MKNVLIFGAGLSAGHLIKYLEKQAHENDWAIHVTDKEESNLSRYSKLSDRVHTFQMDISDEEKVREMVSKADLVISMLPAFMHIRIANHCLAESKSLFTASYVNPDIKKLEKEVNEKNLLFLFNTCYFLASGMNNILLKKGYFFLWMFDAYKLQRISKAFKAKALA